MIKSQITKLELKACRDGFGEALSKVVISQVLTN